MNLSPEIAQAAAWVQEQINHKPFADVGFLVTVHDGQVRKTDYSLTVKTKVPSENGCGHVPGSK